ncbi:hypothetical protein HDU96_009074 [Phlyctochytrium bullatum]|nr:hypothetical protein HDU96_009074 [Phlyctochytrium bullatum]
MRNPPDLLAPLRRLNWDRLGTPYLAALLLLQGGLTYEVLRIVHPDHIPPATTTTTTTTTTSTGTTLPVYTAAPAYAPTPHFPGNPTNTLTNPLRPTRNPAPLLAALHLALLHPPPPASPTSVSPHLTPKPFTLTRDHHLALRWCATIDALTPLRLLLHHTTAVPTPTTTDLPVLLHDLLLAAASSGSPTVTAWLLASRHVDASRNDHLALRAACERGHACTAKLLLEAGSAVDDVPLRMAAANGHAGVVRMLLEAGADPAAMEWDALTGAARYGHADVVAMLIEAYQTRQPAPTPTAPHPDPSSPGTPIRAWEAPGTPAHNHEPPPSPTTDSNIQATPPIDTLGLALKLASREGHALCVSHLLTFLDTHCPCCPSTPCPFPPDPLDMSLGLAAERGHTSVVHLLLSPPSNPGTRPRHRANPTSGQNYALHHAALFGHTDVVALLLRDARCDPSTKQAFALRKAAARGHADVVSLLVAAMRTRGNGALWGLAGGAMFEALVGAARNGHGDTVAALLEPPPPSSTPTADDVVVEDLDDDDDAPAPVPMLTLVEAASAAAEHGHADTFAKLLSMLPGALPPSAQDRVVGAVATAVHRGFAAVLHAALASDPDLRPQLPPSPSPTPVTTGPFRWTRSHLITWSASAALAGSAEAVATGIPACIEMLVGLHDATGAAVLDGEMVCMTLLPACVLRGFDGLVEGMVRRTDVQEALRGFLFPEADTEDAEGETTGPTKDGPPFSPLSEDAFAAVTGGSRAGAPPAVTTSRHTAASTLLLLACTDPILQLPDPSRTASQRPRRARIVGMLLETLETLRPGGGGIPVEMVARAAVKAAQHGFAEVVAMLMGRVGEVEGVSGRALMAGVEGGHGDVVRVVVGGVGEEEARRGLVAACRGGGGEVVGMVRELEGRVGREGREEGVRAAAENGRWEAGVVLAEDAAASSTSSSAAVPAAATTSAPAAAATSTGTATSMIPPDGQMLLGAWFQRMEGDPARLVSERIKGIPGAGLSFFQTDIDISNGKDSRTLLNITDSYLQQLEETGTDASAYLTIYPFKGFDGVTDDQLTELAQRIVRIINRNRSVFLRLYPEMNGSWFNYGQDPEGFIKAWRRAVTFLNNAIGAQNRNRISYIWAPNSGNGYPYPGGISSPNATEARFKLLDTNSDGKLDAQDNPYTPFYPGDEYVDWVGLSIYHYGTQWPWIQNNIPESNKFEGLMQGRGNPSWGNFQFYDLFCRPNGTANKPFFLAEGGATFHMGFNAKGQAAHPNESIDLTTVSRVDIKRAFWRQFLSADWIAQYPQFKAACTFEFMKEEEDTVRDFTNFGCPSTNNTTPNAAGANDTAKAFVEDAKSMTFVRWAQPWTAPASTATVASSTAAASSVPATNVAVNSASVVASTTASNAPATTSTKSGAGASVVAGVLGSVMAVMAAMVWA